MPDLKSKQQLADAAKMLASSFALVQRGTTTFIPVHWETLSPSPPPPLTESIWLPLTRGDKRDLANQQSNILFGSDSELHSFDFMLRQLATQSSGEVDGILVKTDEGLKLLDTRGQLIDPAGTFVPNFIRPRLNATEDDKEFLMSVLVEWLGTEEQAKSLLHHVATVLAPHYSAVKYVLLLGEGRNGKGVFLTMLRALLGHENVSGVTRQMMAERSPTCVELNNKLLNIVFDGEMTYVKDSSMEKTLVAGEPGSVRLLYDSSITEVQTNALFIEALNLEPKARDKSSALQKRLVRFYFPNVYAVDKAFHRKMTSEPMLGALLSLLIDHYVREEDIAEKLSLTKASLDLQQEQQWLGNPVLQYLEHLANSDSVSIKKLEEGQMPVEIFLNSFKPWATTQGIADRSDGDIISLLGSVFDVGWKTKRLNGKPTNVRTIRGLKPEAKALLTTLKGEVTHDSVSDSGPTLDGDRNEQPPGPEAPGEAQADG